MANLPSATLSIDESSSSFAGTSKYIVVLAAVGKNADITPRVFSSSSDILAQHDYSPGADYAAIHMDETGLPVIFVGLPAATTGAATAVTHTGTGTSLMTVTAGANGILEETDFTLTVDQGGTVGTSGCVVHYSADGGRTNVSKRMGTANSITVPFLGIILNFAAGTLVAGDTFHFTTTPPLWDQTGMQSARAALVAQLKLARSWMVIGDLADSTHAGYVTSQTDAYETANERYVLARTSARDRNTGTETFAQYVAALDTAFATVDGEKRIDISLGRARRLSPITGWSFRRPAAWAASCREYNHEVHIPCWRKADGPLTNWDMTDGNGHVVEYDERVNGGALAARFTCLRTYGNGPNGAFVALSLTRDTDNAILSRTQNLYVANVACTVVQAETENAIGQVLVLNDDGTATTDSLQKLEERVNTQLQINLLQATNEGPRASKAVWTAKKDDILSGAGALLHGTLALELNGTLEQIDTVVRVS